MEYLRGNFKVKKIIALKQQGATKDGAERLAEELKETALASLGGSMVYVERETLSWDGEDDDKWATARAPSPENAPPWGGNDRV